jgi:hypothetical protein
MARLTELRGRRMRDPVARDDTPIRRGNLLDEGTGRVRSICINNAAKPPITEWLNTTANTT